MTRQTTLLLAAAAAAMLAACEKPKPVEKLAAPAADAPGCDVARAYVADRLGRIKDKATILIDVAGPDPQMINAVPVGGLTQKYDPTKDNAAGWPKDAPGADLAQAWGAAAKVSPFAACRDFASVVTATGAAIGAVTPGEKPKKGEEELTQMNFSVPVVSADGNEGLLLEVGKTGQGQEIAMMVHLRKDKTGAWKEVDAMAPSLS